MSLEELKLAIQWAAEEGWRPGLHDADCFYPTDPGGFFVGLLNGEPIGCISSVAYGRSIGFMDLYIVRPGFRKRGFGLQLYHAGLAHLKNKNITVIGIEGAMAMLKNTKKWAFGLITAP